MSRRYRKYNSPSKQTLLDDSMFRQDEEKKEDDAPVVKRGPRIARLASLFSSRAVVKSPSRDSSTPKHDSPAPSTTSSSHVGWPGTVDKHGVVYTHSEDSSAAPEFSAEAATPLKGYKNPRDVVSPRSYNTSGPATPKVLSKTSLSAIKYAQSEGGNSQPSGGVAIAARYLERVRQEQQGTQQTTTKKIEVQPESPPKRYTYEMAWPEDVPSFEEGTEASSAYMEVESSYETYGPQPPTEENLRQLAPPHRSFNSPGYRGLIDKTKEVPSLMDNLDSDTDSRATSISALRMDDMESDVFDGISLARESDVFDNISDRRSPLKRSARNGISRYPERIAEEEESHQGQDFKLVILGGGLTTIQTTAEDYTIRQTPSQQSDNRSNSDVDQYGFSRIPNFEEMMNIGKNDDSSLLNISGNFRKNPRKGVVEIYQDDHSSDYSDRSSLFTDPYDSPDICGDLAEYYVPQSSMKLLIRKYRNFSEGVNQSLSLSFEACESIEDETKAFALFEMRSRIMEKDIERGLERRGGTSTVDDIVTTNFYRAAHRIRDAMIVAKAWRDGANPQDVINTHRLTQRSTKTFFVRRPRHNGYFGGLEPRLWVDDADFIRYQCPSLGVRMLHGFEMFTVGDCQSLLLKMTNERCLELREELNDATRRQLELEDEMRAEASLAHSDMTQAELDYIASMEDVKSVSRKLVAAEKAFALVRDRIEKLISRYEALLVKIENDSFAGASSVVTQESSYVSSEYWNAEEERERVMWARRARRAELRAEVAAREAMLAKQEALLIREEKQRELEELKQKLLELQSESSQAIADKEHSVVLARNIANQRGGSFAGEPVQQISRQNIEDVKKRFRDRMAQRNQPLKTPIKPSPPGHRSRYHHSPRHITPSPQQVQRNNLLKLAGEEMYQHLDFYERSLKAVDDSRDENR